MSAPPGPAIETALQRTALAYDRTPYYSRPFPETRPAHLAAIARLFGLVSPDVATARVLEIGCSSGGNLIPVAAAFPEARCIGLDLSPLQIAEAQARAANAGLANIEFRTASVTEVDASWGTFDYIICHGVYSWVPAEVSHAILRVTAERLSDRGVAFISYNVLPGWHLRRVARDVMLTHAARFDEPAQKLTQARAILEFMKDHAPRDTYYASILQREATMLAEHRDDYVLHEFLETENNPCSLTDFVTAAGNAGLGYLGDSEIDIMVPDAHGPQVTAQLRQITAGPVQLEQYLDLLTGRTFRKSILMKRDTLARWQRAPTASHMVGLHVATTFVDPPTPTGPGPFAFKASTDDSRTEAFATLRTASPTIAAALVELGRRWPATATAAELADWVASDAEPREAVLMDVCEALFGLTMAGMLVLSTTPIRVGRADATHPRAAPLVRADAQRGAADTVSLHHQRVGLDATARILLPLLDGTRDRTSLIPAGQKILALTADDRQPDADGTAAAEIIESTLQHLAAVALLVP